jgi:hypothetical protein
MPNPVHNLLQVLMSTCKEMFLLHCSICMQQRALYAFPPIALRLFT